MVKGVLIDLSGTLHIDDFVIPGAIEAINRLRQKGVKIRFATNTTKESRRLLHERLIRLGFDVKPDEIHTSLTAAGDLLIQCNLTKPFLMIDEKAIEDFQDIVETNVEPKDADSVVIGLSPSHFNYQSLNDAFSCIMRGVPLIGIHKSRYFKKYDGLALGPGAFIAALEYSTDCQPIIVGKPEKKFFLDAIKPFDLKPEDCYMIGDDVREDIRGAQSAGFHGILLQTGKYRSGDEEKINPKPEHVFPSIAEAVDHILKQIDG
ncbi:haloacid dehalogenase-like hydrolase domain-containing protein 2 [Tetranychus urticae]|uniref:Haloacid dehalogenase-like hydrolase domain-containing protein 2 n=1 Tax=Tetranychus urticae TaxID=32264 RepID=T1JW75_TETUR|nr:haloacid dehalogenase-like hydrolase domain-containing protein 2 [Tetranychus urticae]